MKDVLLCENNLTALQAIESESIDLIYADPPFNTGRDFREYSDNAEKAQNLAFEKQEWQWLPHQLTPKEQGYFATTHPHPRGNPQDTEPTGAFYLHIDWRTTHVYRFILNQIFGKPAFRNEIIWSYNSQAVFNAIKHSFKNDCDHILFYAKAEHAFVPQFHPLTVTQERTMYPYTDSEGRPLQARQRR